MASPDFRTYVREMGVFPYRLPLYQGTTLMPSSAIAAVGIGLSVAGLAGSTAAAKKQASAQIGALQAEQKAAEIKRQQMEFDARRRIREMIRQNQVVQARATATSVAQGADLSSGPAGAVGDIRGQTGTNILGVSENLAFGEQIFNANAEATGYNIQAAQAGSKLAMWNAIGSLGGTLIRNEAALTRIGNNLFPKTNSYNMAPYYGSAGLSKLY